MRNLLFETLTNTRQSRIQEEEEEEEEMCFLGLAYANSLETFLLMWKLETEYSGRVEHFRILGIFCE
jgi:acyl carrier protein